MTIALGKRPRDRAQTSVVKHGVAFPHARIDLVEQALLGIGRSRADVPFEEANLDNALRRIRENVDETEVVPASAGHSDVIGSGRSFPAEVVVLCPR